VPLVMGRTEPRTFKHLDIAADFDDDIADPPTGVPITRKMKAIMNYTDNWVKTPDYERVRNTDHL
jgi:hypothetical protein